MGNIENDENGGRLIVRTINKMIDNDGEEFGMDLIKEKQREMKLLKRRIQRRAREAARKSLELKKVKGTTTGKTYWE